MDDVKSGFSQDSILGAVPQEAQQTGQAGFNTGSMSSANPEQGDGDFTEASAPGEAVNYEQFSVPEGFEYDDGKVEQFADLARELNLTQQQAQKLVDMHARQWMDHEQQLREVQEEWANKTRSHPEFGGQRFESSLADAMKFVDAFGGSELKAVLNETGVGNHPVLFAAFARAGRLLGEDRLVSGAVRPPSGSGTFADLANTMYPEMGKGGKF